MFFLTYGSDVQWVKNVLAGRCSLRTRGLDVALVDPELSTDAELRIAPPVVRSIGRLVGATQFVGMRAA